MDNQNDKQFTLVSVGTKSRPLPIWDLKTHRGGALMGAKGKLSFCTLRKDLEGINIGERLYAELMRNYPSRGMIDSLIYELKARDPNRTDWQKNSFVSGYVGGPGVGKSFLCKMIGKLVHPKGALYMNCKGVDLGTVFSETIFDTSSAMEERSAIDARLMQHNEGVKPLNPDSIEILKAALKTALVIEETTAGSRLFIDWDALIVEGDTQQAQEYHVKVLTQALRQVCQNEGIPLNEGAPTIGITTRDGIVIRALDKNSADYGRPVLLDELNADGDEDSSDEKLFEFIAFLSDPKVPSITLTGGQNRQVTFNREDIPPTFRLNFTANPNAQGMSRGGFDKALMSRFGAQLDIRTVPDADTIDYADRIASYLTGCPLMQIYESGRAGRAGNHFDGNPHLLVAAANNIREKALTAAEKRALYNSAGLEEAQNINISPKIVEFSKQLGSFFDRLNDLLNPESSFYETSGVEISDEYAQYLDEVQIDLRLVTKLIEKASSISPEAETDNVQEIALAFAGAFDEADELQEDESFGDLMADRGKRLESYITKWLKEVIVPGDAKTRGIDVRECKAVLDLALKEAADNGIGTRAQADSIPGHVTPLHVLFDIDRFESVEEQIRIARNVFVKDVFAQVATLKEQDETIPALPDDMDQALSMQDWQRFIAKAQKARQAKGEVLVVEPDMDHLAQMPFSKGYVVDIATAGDDFEIDFETLIARDGLLVPIAIPDLQSKTLNRLWEGVAGGPKLGAGSAEKIATNRSENEIGLVSVLVQKQGKPDIVHILKGLDTPLVVSSADDLDFVEVLKRQGVAHINYESNAAADKIDRLIQEGSFTDDLILELKEAFLLRNGLDENREADLAKTLGQLMVDVKGVPPVAPVCLTRQKPKKTARKKRSR